MREERGGKNEEKRVKREEIRWHDQRHLSIPSSLFSFLSSPFSLLPSTFP